MSVLSSRASTLTAVPKVSRGARFLSSAAFTKLARTSTPSDKTLRRSIFPLPPATTLDARRTPAAAEAWIQVLTCHANRTRLHSVVNLAPLGKDDFTRQ